MEKFFAVLVDLARMQMHGIASGAAVQSEVLYSWTVLFQQVETGRETFQSTQYDKSTQ